MRLLLTIVALFCVSTFGATNCLQIHSALQIAELQKKNLLKKQTELEARFSAAISRDVDAQAEGVINSIHRNEAKKVFFAQKRLKTAIQKNKARSNKHSPTTVITALTLTHIRKRAFTAKLAQTLDNAPVGRTYEPI